MFTDEQATRRRLARFVREWVRPARVRQCVAVEITHWDVPDEPVPFREAVTHDFTPFTPGQPWSHPWGTTWFHVRGRVPTEWTDEGGRVRTEVVVDLGFTPDEPGFQAEGTVYRADGTVLKGLEPRNAWVPVEVGPGEDVEFYVEAASNPVVMDGDWTSPTPRGAKETAGADPIYRLRALELQRIDTEVDHFLAESGAPGRLGR